MQPNHPPPPPEWNTFMATIIEAEPTDPPAPLSPSLHQARFCGRFSVGLSLRRDHDQHVDLLTTKGVDLIP